MGGTWSGLIKFSIEGEEEEQGGVDMKFSNIQSQFLTNPWTWPDSQPADYLVYAKTAKSA